MKELVIAMLIGALAVGMLYAGSGTQEVSAQYVDCFEAVEVKQLRRTLFGLPLLDSPFMYLVTKDGREVFLGSNYRWRDHSPSGNDLYCRESWTPVKR